MPSGVYKEVTLDFIVDLPPSLSRYDSVTYTDCLTATCRLSKRKHFVLVKELTAEHVADAYYRYIWKDTGYIETIYTDRGKQWVAAFWKRLMQNVGTTNKLSTAWHPQTDRQSENTNKLLEQYLRAYVNYAQDDWVDRLPAAEFAANSVKSETTHVTAFFATLGREPRAHAPAHAKTALNPPTNSEELRADEFANTIEDIHNFCIKQMRFAQARYEQANADRRRPARQYAVNDIVWLDSRNIRTRRPCKKLDHKH